MKIGRLGVHIGCEKMVLVRKVLLAMGYEGAKCGDYVLAERWGEIKPRGEFDMSGGRAIYAE